MNSIVGVYGSQASATQAVTQLQEAGFPKSKISLLGKADLVDNHIHIKNEHTAEKAEVSIGVVAGTVLGVLTGIGVFAIPGLGFLFGAGALVGAFAGLDFGLIGGGLVAVLTSMGVDQLNAQRYEKHLNEGKFLVFLQGKEEDLKKAQEVLHTGGLHMELDYN